MSGWWGYTDAVGGGLEVILMRLAAAGVIMMLRAAAGVILMLRLTLRINLNLDFTLFNVNFTQSDFALSSQLPLEP